MKPFLLLATREEDDAAAGELDGVLRYGGLTADQVRRVRLEREPLPRLDLDDYSGVLVGGGPFNSSDPPGAKSALQRRVEHDFATLLDEVVDRDFPFLGLCYGVGTLGAHQGAVVDRTYGEPIGPVSIDLTPDGVADPLLAGMPPRFDALVGHKEAVRELPAHAVLLASSATCPVQMFRVRENLYATQFHPELDITRLRERITIYRDHGYFAPEEYEETLERASARPVPHPHRILRAFVERYARPARLP
ncbi:glutamine amidotransferase [Xylanimonas ulmi]|uniref:GMP synthase (Glutamine-hydrolysing) n=1 Tax=Xylanimonas ulmi TaxID=228973 RepID=A0A4Q7M3R0_9MICO|nr:glutamine amidotransferase [Xylanibacterium ulmi]RZS62566.1 GMP synthase (glutamine-hydrolysing) [Xylanibacterium ulmi]